MRGLLFRAFFIPKKIIPLLYIGKRGQLLDNYVHHRHITNTWL